MGVILRVVQIYPRVKVNTKSQCPIHPGGSLERGTFTKPLDSIWGHSVNTGLSQLIPNQSLVFKVIFAVQESHSTIKDVGYY